MFDAVSSNHSAPGDQYMDSMGDTGNSLMGVTSHALDAEPARKVLRQLLEWYYLERERQSINRMDMAMDSDFYDNIQWDPEDAAELRDRHRERHPRPQRRLLEDHRQRFTSQQRSVSTRRQQLGLELGGEVEGGVELLGGPVGELEEVVQWSVVH
jgi:hypothetical protein